MQDFNTELRGILIKMSYTKKIIQEMALTGTQVSGEVFIQGRRCTEVVQVKLLQERGSYLKSARDESKEQTGEISPDR